MERVKTGGLALLALTGSALAQILGGVDMILQVLLGFMTADLITGVLVAWLWKKSRKTPGGALDSRAGARGLARKMMILLFVALGVLLDRLTGNDFLRDAVCMFYIGNEGLSILENTAIMGLPWPESVKNALEVMRKQGDGDQNTP